MIAFSQNFPNYDIGLNADGSLALATGKEAFSYIIADAVRTLTGELQLDVEAGIPWLDSVFNEIGDTSLWEHKVRETVDAFPFVTSIESFTSEYNFSSKTLKYHLEVLTDEGIVEVSNG